MKNLRKKYITYSRINQKHSMLSIILMLILIIIFSSACSSKVAVENENSNTNDAKITIAVSVAPQKSIVEKITKDKANIITMIPQGFSPENYQPKPSSLEKLSTANLYFTIDIPTEAANILPSLNDINSNIKIVDLFDAASEEYKVLSFDLYDEIDTKSSKEVETEVDSENIDSDHQHDGADPHIWLSPKRISLMSKVILDEMILIDPENEEFYTNNYNNFLIELDKLDKHIVNSLKEFEGKSFIIYHPSLGYYSDDYNLKMIAIEENGKAATAKSLEKVIEFAKTNDIKVIFYQSEIDSSQVKVIASEIAGQVLEINPLKEDIIENLYELTEILKNNLK